LYIPQRAIVESGLLGNVTTDAWLLLDYLRRWVTCPNVKKLRFRERDFIWIKYPHACRELPILFPGEPLLRTKINKMVLLIASLKKCGLIDTKRLGTRCYIHFTENARKLYAHSTTERASHNDKNSVTSVCDVNDMENHDGSIMYSHGDNKKELDKTEQEYTQNSYSNDKLECVKRWLETIFPKRNWSNTEMALLREQIPIPEWELKLITRFYRLPAPAHPYAVGKDLTPDHFLLVRRRHSMKTLLEHWSDEVFQAVSFFKTAAGRRQAEREGWDLSEMRCHDGS
jgi:hypothetical protein